MTNYFEVDKVITCAGTAPIASTAVDIYAIKVGKDPLLMKRLLAVSGGNWTTTMTVPSSYVSPFGEVYLKVVDSFNPTIAGTKFYTIDPTLTIDTPTLTGGESGTVTGTSNHVGQNVEVELRLAGQTPEDSWTPFGTATVGALGTWSATATAPAAGTYDFRVIDAEIDPAVCFAQVDDVVVASAYTEGSRILVANRENTYLAQFSSDSGTNFADIGGAIEDNTRGVALSADGKYGLLGGSNGYLIKINNGVASSAVATSNDWVMCAMSDSGQYQLAISTAGYYFSNDYGVTWNGLQTAKVFTTCAINPTGQYIAIFQSTGKAYFSNDYGANWTERTMSGVADKCCMTPDGSRVYYGNNASGATTYRCTSNGATQTSIGAGGCANIVCRDDGLVIQQRYGNYTDISTNYGTTWSSTISTGVTQFYAGSGKLSPDGSIFFCCSSAGYICTLQSPWTTYSAKAHRPYAGMIDCTYDGKYVVCSRNELGTGGIGYSDDYGANWTTKLSTSRTWSKIAISTKKLPS